MGEDVNKRLLRRASTRYYEGVLDDFCDGYGSQRSSVSQHWRAATKKQPRTFFERDLSSQHVAVIMIDGISFQEFPQIAAQSAYSDGTKQLLRISKVRRSPRRS